MMDFQARAAALTDWQTAGLLIGGALMTVGAIMIVLMAGQPEGFSFLFRG